MTSRDHIVVVGCGSIGLPLATALATCGLEVTGFDVDESRLAKLVSRTEAITETLLAENLNQVITSGRLQFTDRLASSRSPRTYIVTVPTPYDEASGFNAQFLREAVKSIAAVAQPRDALFIRSTVPIGTTRKLCQGLLDDGIITDAAAIPDRTVEGRAFAELFTVPHLYGGLNEGAGERAANIFAALGKTIDMGSAEHAEAAKLFTNTARTVMFGFANEVGKMCELLGLDAYRIIAAAGENYSRFPVPRPGPVGGPCLAKDVKLLELSLGAYSPAMARAAYQSNAAVLDTVVARIGVHLQAAGVGAPRIALLGIAFKGRPAVADFRQSAALAIKAQVMAEWPGAKLAGWDAEIAREEITRLGFEAHADALSASRNAHIVVLANDHPQLADLDFAAIARGVAAPALLYDLCGMSLAHPFDFAPRLTRAVLGIGAS